MSCNNFPNSLTHRRIARYLTLPLLEDMQVVLNSPVTNCSLVSTLTDNTLDSISGYFLRMDSCKGRPRSEDKAVFRALNTLCKVV